MQNLFNVPYVGDMHTAIIILINAFTSEMFTLDSYLFDNYQNIFVCIQIA